MRIALRLAVAAACLLPLAACFSYHEQPKQPDNVVVTPPPSGGTTVVTPRP